jgi:hypothetical protein
MRRFVEGLEKTLREKIVLKGRVGFHQDQFNIIKI